MSKTTRWPSLVKKSPVIQIGLVMDKVERYTGITAKDAIRHGEAMVAAGFHYLDVSPHLRPFYANRCAKVREAAAMMGRVFLEAKEREEG